jgi:hypothetical protein
VFGGDNRIAALISDIYKAAVNLHALQAEEADSRGEERTNNLRRQGEIKDFFAKTQSEMESVFGK